jgi:hypothetical protein
MSNNISQRDQDERKRAWLKKLSELSNELSQAIDEGAPMFGTLLNVLRRELAWYKKKLGLG